MKRCCIVILVLALCGAASAQRATLVVHNNTDATLLITILREEGVHGSVSFGSVSVPPLQKADLYNKLPMGQLDFEISAPHVRPAPAPITKRLWVSGQSAYALSVYPRDFGLTHMFDAGSSRPADTAASPVGVWIWPSGDPIEFHPNGVVTIRGNRAASWSWVDTHQFRINWDHGYTDQAVVQGDVMLGSSWANNAPDKKLRLEARRAR